jgi:hypothetical protein
MIRREDQGDWLLIDQQEHAHLAAEIAAVWCADASTQPDVPQWARDQIALAVARHDDGWLPWDRAPRIDPATGAPRDFMEMRMVASTEIWSRSIEECATHPLTAYAISRHFCYLAEQVRDGGRSDPDDLEAVDHFLERQAAVEASLSEAASTANQGEAFERWREMGFRTVQFFDRLSLWLCCAERSEAQTLISPAGQAVNLIPKPARRDRAGSEQAVDRREAFRPGARVMGIGIEPYPLCVESLDLRVDARSIAARRYADDADLNAALEDATIVELVWAIGRV